MALLSDTKVVYAAGGIGDNVIIRSMEEERFRAFGLSGSMNIVNAFYAILAMLADNCETFIDNSFDNARELIEFLGCISDLDRQRMQKLRASYRSNGDDPWLTMCSVEITKDTHVVLSLVGRPQLALLKMDIDGVGEEIIKFGIYLQQKELCKLLTFLNTTHNINPAFPRKPPSPPNLSNADLLA